jgi:GDP-L-fucose synthase
VKTTDRIFVTGHQGLAGSAIVAGLKQRGYQNLILRSRLELDLMNSIDVSKFFELEKPEYVFMAAAKVGGILANKSFPGEFIHENLAMQLNVIEASRRNHVKRLIFLASSSIYPKSAPQPLREDSLMTGPLEDTNRPYAVAKLAGIEQCWAYNRQYGTRYIALIPTNLYGPGDRYDLRNSHVLPSLLQKIVEARDTSQAEVVVWGSGDPLREFLFSADMADACIFVANLTEETYGALLCEDIAPVVNVGSGIEISIKDLANSICSAVGYSGNLVFDATKPDGVMRKLLDSTRIKKLGWSSLVSLEDGIILAYESAANAGIFGK